ncbi:hypothetical protein E2562_024843 [Oryza meyeriana var. granulata]|uniref:Uncharacterized protein n=1 Tax=Oryza meyeriana var. granulata TaxID=110450 RepID=A0A6G1CI32_9ORYZ|nr:hypothetical protein E2562_024843 [Oryza meyeriana var. granulata]
MAIHLYLAPGREATTVTDNEPKRKGDYLNTLSFPIFLGALLYRLLKLAGLPKGLRRLSPLPLCRAF